MKGGSTMSSDDRSLVNSNKEKSERTEDRAAERRPWQPMKLSYTGDAKDVVKGGTGKLSGAPNDPGEPRKTPPSG